MLITGIKTRDAMHTTLNLAADTRLVIYEDVIATLKDKKIRSGCHYIDDTKKLEF